jgi:hypothetical protein
VQVDRHHSDQGAFAQGQYLRFLASAYANPCANPQPNQGKVAVLDQTGAAQAGAGSLQVCPRRAKKVLTGQHDSVEGAADDGTTPTAVRQQHAPAAGLSENWALVAIARPSEMGLEGGCELPARCDKGGDTTSKAGCRRCID